MIRFPPRGNFQSRGNFDGWKECVCLSGMDWSGSERNVWIGFFFVFCFFYPWTFCSLWQSLETRFRRFSLKAESVDCPRDCSRQCFCFRFSINIIQSLIKSKLLVIFCYSSGIAQDCWTITRILQGKCQLHLCVFKEKPWTSRFHCICFCSLFLISFLEQIAHAHFLQSHSGFL